MAEVAPAPAAAAPAKAPKKKAAAKPKKAGPSVGELIVKAVSASKERSGVSLAALKKSLAAGGYDVEKNNSRVKIAVKSLVTKGTRSRPRAPVPPAPSSSTRRPSRQRPFLKASPQSKKVACQEAREPRKPKKVAAKKAVAAKKSPKKARSPPHPKRLQEPKEGEARAAAKLSFKTPRSTSGDAKPFDSLARHLGSLHNQWCSQSDALLGHLGDK
uniref:H15 domain-containing protein n=1 Tax=Oncorhynchus kisutch TaxID=8019 RepID=A0A8C7ISA1_ONCKI